MSSIPIAGLVLAGGASRRMGRAGKTLLDLAGRPLIARVIERLAPQVARLAISANEDGDRFAEFGLPVLPDRYHRRRGPLAGILAGMEWAAGEGFSHLASGAGDTPFLPPDLVSRLCAAIGTEGAGIAVAASGGQVHAVFALWPVSLKDALAAHLDEADDLSVIAFARKHGHVSVAFVARHGIDPFFNVNTPEDLEAARGMVAGDGS